jgi:hypothetical protein
VSLVLRRISDNNSPKILNNITAIWRSLLRMWWVFLIIGIVSGLLGILYASKQKAEYKSHLTFALDDAGGGGGMGSLLSLASQFGLSMGGGSDIFTGDNILEIMKSRRMVESVLLSIDTFDNKPYRLIEFYLEDSHTRMPGSKIADIHYPINLPRDKFSYRQDSLLYVTYLKFKSNYIIAQRPDRKLSFYEVSITSNNEKFTKVFTDRIVTETNNYYIEIRTKKAKETLGVLEQRVAAMKGNLNASITERAVVQDVNVNPAFSAAQIPVIKQQTNIQAYSAAYGEMFKNLELARFQYLNEIPLMQIIDPAEYPMEKIKWGKLKGAIIFSFLAELIFLVTLFLRQVFKKK